MDLNLADLQSEYDGRFKALCLAIESQAQQIRKLYQIVESLMALVDMAVGSRSNDQGPSINKTAGAEIDDRRLVAAGRIPEAAD